MKRILITAAAVAMTSAALAQQSSTGQSSGGPLVQRGPTTTGSIVIPAERRTMIRQRFCRATGDHAARAGRRRSDRSG